MQVDRDVVLGVGGAVGVGLLTGQPVVLLMALIMLVLYLLVVVLGLLRRGKVNR